MTDYLEKMPEEFRARYSAWGSVVSITGIKSWLKANMTPQLNMCLMAQLDAVYMDLTQLGLDEIVTSTGIRPHHTRDGLVVKYVMGINFIHEGTPLAYEIVMTPDDKGEVIKFETTYGKVLA